MARAVGSAGTPSRFPHSVQNVAPAALALPHAAQTWPKPAVTGCGGLSVACRKSRIPRPSCAPTSGRRPAPKTISTMTRTTTRWIGWSAPTAPVYAGTFGLPPGSSFDRPTAARALARIRSHRVVTPGALGAARTGPYGEIRHQAYRQERRREDGQTREELTRHARDPRALDARDGEALPARPTRPHGRRGRTHGPRDGAVISAL